MVFKTKIQAKVIFNQKNPLHYSIIKVENLAKTFNNIVEVNSKIFIAKLLSERNDEKLMILRGTI